MVDEESRAKIRGSTLELRVIQETGRPAFKRRGRQLEMAQNQQGHCVFLDGQQLCSVHGELGGPSKPLGCHQFPFQSTITPDGVYVGVSFYCNAAQRNEGRPLQVHAQSVAAVLDQADEVGLEPMPVHRKVTISWEAYKVLEECLLADLDSTLTGLSRIVAATGGRRRCLTSDDVVAALTGADMAHLTRAAQPFWPVLTGYLPGQTPPAEPPERLEPWAEADLDRYLKALIFRKFLLIERPILHNLSMVYLLPRLFRFCVESNRLARGSEKVDPVDIWRTLDDLEFYLFTHATGLDRTYARLAQAMVDAMASEARQFQAAPLILGAGARGLQ